MILTTRSISTFLLRSAALAALFLAAPVSRGALSFVFDYSSAPEFTAPGIGATRTAAFEQAALTLGSFFADTAILQFKVVSENANTTTLASAGSDLVSGDPGFLRTIAQAKAITGVDLNGLDPDGNVNWNFVHNWDYGDNVTTGFDFKSTVIHELCHALGFISYIGAPGSNSGTTWTTMDSFITDKNGAPMINPTTFAFDTSKNGVIIGGSVSGNANGVHFSGPQAMAANSGARVPFFSPTTYSAGSSGSHLDDAYYTTVNLLMESATDVGPGARTFSAIEVGIFKDLGYTLVPEPGSALLVLGAGAALLVRRWRLVA
jgi:hypothetical protein